MRHARSVTAVLFLVLSSLPAHRAQASTRLEAQYQRSVQGMLANLQENGAITASPSRSEPNYSFNWVRDTALTMKTVAELAYDPSTPKELKSTLLKKLDRWVEWELRLQIQSTLTGLGEPRFHLDGTPNHDPWGRPQNDGPALRAITAIRIANEWLREGRFQDVQKRLYAPVLPAVTLVKRDLEYVAHHWREQSFDPWEEERALHFYTLTVQKTALTRGAQLASRLNDPWAASFYRSQAAQIEQTLARFYDPVTQELAYAVDHSSRLPHKTSTRDIAVILAALHTFDGTMNVPVIPALRTLRGLIRDFSTLYEINRSDTGAQGVALGRYPEDRYDGNGFTGGNPWFLSTLAAAEFYCDLGRAGAYSKEIALRLALPQFDRVLFHLNDQGDMSEQFQRVSGFQQGAVHLTWSYASFITAYRSCFGMPAW